MITPGVLSTSEALLGALLDARRVELALLDDLTDTQMLGTRAHFLEPPIWEMGHVGWFQEYWLFRRLDGADPMLPGADDIYDSFSVSYTRHWDHRFPSRAATLAYITEVLRRSVGRLESREPRDDEAYFYTLAAQHEDMHAENLTAILQTLGYARPASLPPASAPPPVDREFRAVDVAVPGGTFMLGADPAEPFVFDNEKWAHPVEAAPFRIAATPVTNAEFQAFVEDGGYRRRECWGRRGWDWRRRERAEQPLFWQRDGGRSSRGTASCTSSGAGRRRSVAGRGGGCPPRRSGSWRPRSIPPRDASVGSPGAMRRRRPSAPISTTAPAARSTCARCRPATVPSAVGR